MSDLASVDQLLRPARRRYKELVLPVSGLKVRLQSLTEREVQQYQLATVSQTGTGLKRSRLEDAARRLLVLCLVDSAGNRILGEQHLQQLAEWDAADSNFLYQECAAHAGLKTEDIEGLVKNSQAMNVVD
ncbi:MAG: hypothetical protein ACOY3P_07030 [Planctomycetota bacterium]